MTPNTMDSLNSKSQKALDYEYSTARPGRTNPNNLRDQIAVDQGDRRWPTPTTAEAGKISSPYGQPGLSNHPAIVGYRGDRPKMQKSRRGDGQSTKPVTDSQNEQRGQLNPGWVEWLMGLPLGWTALEPLVENAYEYWLDSTVEGTWWDYDPAEIAQPWSDETTPRVVRGMKNRAKRLKALGNGIVPAVVKLFLAGH